MEIDEGDKKELSSERQEEIEDVWSRRIARDTSVARKKKVDGKEPVEASSGRSSKTPSSRRSGRSKGRSLGTDRGVSGDEETLINGEKEQDASSDEEELHGNGHPSSQEKKVGSGETHDEVSGKGKSIGITDRAKILAHMQKMIMSGGEKAVKEVQASMKLSTKLNQRQQETILKPVVEFHQKVVRDWKELGMTTWWETILRVLKETEIGSGEELAQYLTEAGVVAQKAEKLEEELKRKQIAIVPGNMSCGFGEIQMIYEFWRDAFKGVSVVNPEKNCGDKERNPLILNSGVKTREELAKYVCDAVETNVEAIRAACDITPKEEAKAGDGGRKRTRV